MRKASDKSISEATRNAILEATLRLLEERGSLDIPQAEIASAAGVSRQSLFYAFGSRTGLLIALVRRVDEGSVHVARLGVLSRGDRADRALLGEYVDVFIDYLPSVYPIGVLLDAAALTDADARAALDDRMKGALLGGLVTVMRRLEAAGWLAEGLDARTAAELVLSIVQFSAWRHLVVECGWSAEAFRTSRHLILDRVVLAAMQRPAPVVSARSTRAARDRPVAAAKRRAGGRAKKPGH